MIVHWDALAAIAAMALATFACRAGGYWLFRVLKPSRGTKAMLSYVPGTLFVSYVVPALLAGGPAQWAGGLATVVLMRWLNNLGLAVVGGTAACWAVWAAA